LSARSVVDDDADARELNAMTLSSAGATVFTAGSVREALRLFEQQRPGLLLTDIAMPGEDGFDLIRIVRETCHRQPQHLATVDPNLSTYLTCPTQLPNHPLRDLPTRPAYAWRPSLTCAVWWRECHE
jgi:CheY-like chemotaxis protein